MKRFTLLTMLISLLSVTAFAQKGLNPRLLQSQIHLPITKMMVKDASHPVKSTANRVKGLASSEKVTPPEGATMETWYTASGKFYVPNQSNTWSNLTSEMKTIKVVFDGDNVYLQGLAYWFKESWIKGTINGSTVRFENGQYLGEDNYGAEYIVGSDDGDVLSDAIIFDYDAEKGILSSKTTYIFENGKDNEVAPYCFWQQPTFTKEEPVAPEVVVAPEDLEVEEYVLLYVNNAKEVASNYLYIGFAGNDVYIKGLSSYLPDSWVKGTLEGSTITLPGNQYFGPYDGSYSVIDMFLQPQDVVFNYDAESNILIATETITIVTGDEQKADIYEDAIISKVVEKAGTPATPVITEIYESEYGPVAFFNIPVIDVEGNGMASSKLSYQLFYDVEQEISPVTFDPKDFTKLSEAMTVIPYGFTEDWDFYPDYIFMNQPDFKNWNKIGIQSIYTGGGEEHKSEISWLTLQEYGKAGFDFNAMVDEPCSSNNSTDGDITENRVLTEGGVTLTISPKDEEVNTANRFWKTVNGPQLRVYSGTLTFEAPAGKVITKIEFNAAKWNDNNSADTGAFEGSTWTGEANKVVVSIAGNTQLNSIIVYCSTFVPEPVEAPEGLETETYLFKGTAVEAKLDPEEEVEEPYNAQIEVGFDGNDVYFKGVSPDAPDLWLKGTKNEAGQYVIPANQYMGLLELWGGLFTFEYYFTAIDETGKMVDVILDFDAEKSQFTTNQTLVLNGALGELDPYITFNNVIIEKFVEVAATPADPTFEAIKFEDTEYPCIYCSIPAVGTNGEVLNLNKLYYTVWIEKAGQQQPYVFTQSLYRADFEEDVVEVPYNHDGYDVYAYGEIIYFEEEIEELNSWTKVGIQSIYKGAGEEHKSNVVWMENAIEDGISNVKADLNAGKAMIFNIAGQRLDTPQKGLNIINGRKVVVK